MSTNRYVYVTYCDDIRQEIGGKLTLVGCYGADLIALRKDDEPVVLPKLCAHVHIVTPVDKPFKALKISVFYLDQTLAELDIPVPETVKSSSAEATDDTRLLVASAHMAFVPFVVSESEGKLRIEVETESETLRGPALRVITKAASGTG